VFGISVAINEIGQALVELAALTPGCRRSARVVFALMLFNVLIGVSERLVAVVAMVSGAGVGGLRVGQQGR